MRPRTQQILEKTNIAELLKKSSVKNRFQLNKILETAEKLDKENKNFKK